MSEITWKILPEEFLREIGWNFNRRGDWLSLKKCPYCDGGSGGSGGDVFTFAVHSKDGNFFCHRSKCGMRGSFWKLIELNNRDPRDFVGERLNGLKKKKKKFIYGK